MRFTEDKSCPTEKKIKLKKKSIIYQLTNYILGVKHFFRIYKYEKDMI